MALPHAGYFLQSLTDDRGNALKHVAFQLIDDNDNSVSAYTDAERTSTASLVTDGFGNAKFWVDADIGPIYIRMGDQTHEYPIPITVDGRDIGDGEDGDRTYIWEQAIPSANWSVKHNLNCYPSVAVVDSTGNIVDTGIRYINANLVMVVPSGAMSGFAYLNY